MLVEFDNARVLVTDMKIEAIKDIIPILPGTPPDIVTSRVTLTPGSYVVRWQVLAVDGHITRGDVPLTVTAP